MSTVKLKAIITHISNAAAVPSGSLLMRRWRRSLCLSQQHTLRLKSKGANMTLVYQNSASTSICSKQVPFCARHLLLSRIVVLLLCVWSVFVYIYIYIYTYIYIYIYISIHVSTVHIIYTYTYIFTFVLEPTVMYSCIFKAATLPRCHVTWAFLSTERRGPCGNFAPCFDVLALDWFKGKSTGNHGFYH